jgi:hypothetical protein
MGGRLIDGDPLRTVGDDLIKTLGRQSQEIGGREQDERPRFWSACAELCRMCDARHIQPFPNTNSLISGPFC